MFSLLRNESPKTVSCTVRNCVLGCFAWCETGFARCERLFWDSRPRETKSLLALSLKHFWAFWLFWHLCQVSWVAILANLHGFSRLVLLCKVSFGLQGFSPMKEEFEKKEFLNGLREPMTFPCKGKLPQATSFWHQKIFWA